MLFDILVLNIENDDPVKLNWGAISAYHH